MNFYLFSLSEFGFVIFLLCLSTVSLFLNNHVKNKAIKLFLKWRQTFKVLKY